MGASVLMGGGFLKKIMGSGGHPPWPPTMANPVMTSSLVMISFHKGIYIIVLSILCDIGKD